MRWSGVLVSLLLLGVFAVYSAHSTPDPAAGTRINLGHSTVSLNGPWRFHTGDDQRWASPDFDDSGWESVDLTPAAGAHDDDVGLPGYVAGWSKRGHAHYSGYAWYRTKVTVHSDAGSALALAGPTLLDSAYQLYVNGKLLGESSPFSHAPLTIYAVRPSVHALPPSDTQTYDIAFRVWLDPLEAGADSGGMHVAPVIGGAEAIQQLYEAQWLRTFKGYVVDAVEPLAFVGLALMVAALMASRTRDTYRWLFVALLLLALLRVHQVLFFWTHMVSLRGYDVAVTVLLRPLSLGAWLLAWRDWFRLNRYPWLTRVIGALTLAYVLFECLGRPWFAAEATHGIKPVAHLVVTGLRLALAALYLWIIGYGLARSMKPSSGLAALAAVLVGAGLFATEINVLGVPGIWFPYGTGVSRSQYAYAGFIALMFASILVRLAGREREQPQPSSRSIEP